eukprot:3309092-Pyramimonas_sp.AAC.1
MTCCYFVRERDGLFRELGKDCTGSPLKGDSAGRVRKQRRELLLAGNDPKTREPLAIGRCISHASPDGSS